MRIATGRRLITMKSPILPTLLQYNEDCDCCGVKRRRVRRRLPTLLQYNEDCDSAIARVPLPSRRLPTLLQYNEDCDWQRLSTEALPADFQPCSSTMRIATSRYICGRYYASVLPTLLQYNEDCDSKVPSWYWISTLSSSNPAPVQ